MCVCVCVRVHSCVRAGWAGRGIQRPVLAGGCCGRGRGLGECSCGLSVGAGSMRGVGGHWGDSRILQGAHQQLRLTQGVHIWENLGVALAILPTLGPQNNSRIFWGPDPGGNTPLGVLR